MPEGPAPLPREPLAQASRPPAVQPGPIPGAPGGVVVVPRGGRRRAVVRRFLRHRLAVASLVVLLAVVLLALLGGRLWTYRYDEITDDLSRPPSWSHPMGTDNVGRDTFAQVLRGAQKSVQIALVVALVSTAFGTLVGALAGFYRGWLDALLMRATDLLLVIPALAIFGLLAHKVSTADDSWLLLALVIAAVSWTTIARVVRGVFLSLREREFVEAARALGASDRHIVLHHLLPNATGPIVVNATITVAVAILVETSLSYLGLGIRPPDTSLGLLVSHGQQAATTRPWLFYFPGLFIVLITLSVNFVGDGLRDAFDPARQRRRS